MDKFKFNMISINTRGLVDRKKRRSMFRYIKKKKADICFMQETHSSIEAENVWKNEWGGSIIFSHGTKHARGVMVLFRPGLDIEVLQTSSDNIGRMLFLCVKIQNVQFNLINIYAPNYEENQIHFYRSLKNIMTQNSLNAQDNILLGGDFNIILNSQKDRKSQTPTQFSNMHNQIINLVKEILALFEMHDIWRIRNPLASRFTWSRSSPYIIQSRLDYWFTSETLFDFADEVDIIPCTKSDHSAITIQFNSFSSGTNAY